MWLGCAAVSLCWDLADPFRSVFKPLVFQSGQLSVPETPTSSFCLQRGSAFNYGQPGSVFAFSALIRLLEGPVVVVIWFNVLWDFLRRMLFHVFEVYFLNFPGTSFSVGFLFGLSSCYYIKAFLVSPKNTLNIVHRVHNNQIFLFGWTVSLKYTCIFFLLKSLKIISIAALILPYI